MYICICMCICIYVYMYTYIYIYIHIHREICKFMCIYIYIYIIIIIIITIHIMHIWCIHTICTHVILCWCLTTSWPRDQAKTRPIDDASWHGSISIGWNNVFETLHPRSDVYRDRLDYSRLSDACNTDLNASCVDLSHGYVLQNRDSRHRIWYLRKDLLWLDVDNHRVCDGFQGQFVGSQSRWALSVASDLFLRVCIYIYIHTCGVYIYIYICTHI